ncbi:MAG: YcxB family protein [Sphingomonadales bacterium]|nr:YcxB family protein [Sphingomonadales bacterium]MBU3992114.1 YcxB family protein [Alphaproteobacteria bacterium]
MSEGFEIRLSEADLVAAFRLNANFRKVRPLILAAVLVASLLGLILLISPAARLSATSRPLTLLLEGALAMLLLLVLGLAVAIRPLWRAMARRGLAQRPDLAGPIRYAITPQALHHVTVHSASALPWASLHGWREDDRTLLVFLSAGLFYPIPKAQVDADQLAALRDTLTAHRVRYR